MGFVEGARVEIIHEGFIGHDPIAVRLDDTRIALRRRDARSVLVRPRRLLVCNDRRLTSMRPSRPPAATSRPLNCASPWSATLTRARPPCSTP